jgi:hypothetical protein
MYLLPKYLGNMSHFWLRDKNKWTVSGPSQVDWDLMEEQSDCMIRDYERVTERKLVFWFRAQFVHKIFPSPNMFNKSPPLIQCPYFSVILIHDYIIFGNSRVDRIMTNFRTVYIILLLLLHSTTDSIQSYVYTSVL